MIRIEHPASNGSADEFDDNVRAPIDDLSDEDTTREEWQGTTLSLGG